MLSEAFILILTKRLGFTERIGGDCDRLTVSSLICLLSCSSWLSCFAVIVLICSRCSWFSCWYLIASSSRSALRFSANCRQHSSQYITVSDDTKHNTTLSTTPCPRKNCNPVYVAIMPDFNKILCQHWQVKWQTSQQISVKSVNICNSYSKFSNVTQKHKCPL